MNLIQLLGGSNDFYGTKRRRSSCTSAASEDSVLSGRCAHSYMGSCNALHTPVVVSHACCPLSLPFNMGGLIPACMIQGCCNQETHLTKIMACMNSITELSLNQFNPIPMSNHLIVTWQHAPALWILFHHQGPGLCTTTPIAFQITPRSMFRTLILANMQGCYMHVGKSHAV